MSAHRSRLLRGTVALALAAGLAACGDDDEKSAATQPGTAAPASTPAGDAQGLVVYTLNASLSFPFQASIDQGIHDKAKELGVEVRTLDAKNKTENEASNVQDMLTQKPSGVILQPVDGKAAMAEVASIAGARVPLVVVHTQVGEGDFTKPPAGVAAFVSQGEFEAGKQAGELAVQALPSGGKVAIVEGSTCCFQAIKDRTDGFKSALDSKTFEVVATQPGAWVADQAEAACQNMLAGNPDIALFYAHSDDMGAGCVKAIKAANSKALVIGIGGSKLGVDQVKAGGMYGTVCYKPYDMGQLAMQTMYDQLTGAASHNQAYIPYVTPGVTKANIDTCTPQW